MELILIKIKIIVKNYLQIQLHLYNAIMDLQDKLVKIMVVMPYSSKTIVIRIQIVYKLELSANQK